MRLVRQMCQSRAFDSMSGPTIYPTHCCFDDAIEYCEWRVKADGTVAHRNDFLLVHAIVDPPDGPGPHAHAWVEDGPRVIFAGLFEGEKVWVEADKAEYLVAIRVLDVTRYTMAEALATARAHDFVSGPWKPEYRQLCRG